MIKLLSSSVRYAQRVKTTSHKVLLWQVLTGTFVQCRPGWCVPLHAVSTTVVDSPPCWCWALLWNTPYISQLTPLHQAQKNSRKWQLYSLEALTLLLYQVAVQASLPPASCWPKPTPHPCQAGKALQVLKPWVECCGDLHPCEVGVFLAFLQVCCECQHESYHLGRAIIRALHHPKEMAQSRHKAGNTTEQEM